MNEERATCITPETILDALSQVVRGEIIELSHEVAEGAPLMPGLQPPYELSMHVTTVQREELFTQGMGATNGGAFRGSMQHEPDVEVSWCDDVARAWRWLRRRNCGAGGDTGNR